jgi:short-subunit dehydrogenase
MSKQNQVVWVTGASSGIGKEMALQYAAKGYSVAVSARRIELLNELVNDIKTKGGDGMAVACDVTEESEIENAIQRIVQQYGKIDIAVANAGCGVVGFMDNLSKQDWYRQFNINVLGLAMTAKHVMPELKKTKGRLVLIGSISAFLPNPFIGAYGASKAAVHNIGESYQVELKGSGVSCTTIHPGFVDSHITRVDNQGVFHPEAKDPRPANLMWPTDKAVVDMIKAIEKRKKVAVITRHGKVFVFIGRFFPGLARIMMHKQIQEIMKHNNIQG